MSRMHCWILTCLMVALAAPSVSLADSIIASWNFDGITVVDANLSVAADIGVGTVSLDSGLNHQVREGNGSPQSLAFSDVDPGEFAEAVTSTLGYSDIVVDWFQNGTANGTTTWDFQYSTDGVNFATFIDDYDVPRLGIWMDDQTGGTFFSADLSGVTALNNQAEVWFRWAAAVDGNDLGLNQIDDLEIRGTSAVIPLPATASMALALLCASRRRRALVRDSK